MGKWGGEWRGVRGDCVYWWEVVWGQHGGDAARDKYLQVGRIKLCIVLDAHPKNFSFIPQQGKDTEEF